jgi:heptaprenyl diphosphate synthase
VEFEDFFRLLPPLRQDIDRVIAVIRRSLSAEEGLMAEAVHHLIGAPGGYARPALVLAGSYATQMSDDLGGVTAAVITGAAAVELLNVGTLYQDDVIDHDDVRRGVPSVNAKWGDGPAIVAGDHLMFIAVQLALELDQAIASEIVNTACALFRGEMRELEDRKSADATESSYLKAVSGKQAALLATACKLGAILSNGRPSAVQALERYGYGLGIAGQIIDDILDITATPEFLGKSAGSDLRGGICTLPIIYALRRSPKLRNLIDSGINDANLEEAKCLIVSSGAIEEGRRTAEHYIQNANAALAAARLNERVTNLLSAFATEILTGACWRG